jgi:hypothetical protein
MSSKDRTSSLSLTLKRLSNQPLNAVHATPELTHLPQLLKEPDITISQAASRLLKQSNGLRLETPPANQLEKHRDKPRKNSATSVTTPPSQVAIVLPYAAPPECSRILFEYLTRGITLTFIFYNTSQ